jgi:hypothetical protein
MLAVLGSCVVILAVIGLGFYAVQKMRPGSFRMRTTLMRMFSFSMEIESSGSTREPSDGTGRDFGAARAEGDVPDAAPKALPGE